MRVAIDAHALGTGAGGNETYVRATLEALAAHAPGVTPVALTRPGWNGELPAGVEKHPLHVSNSWLRVAFDLPYVLRYGEFDLFHAQYIAPPFCPRPMVVSIHDVVWKRHPETLPPLTRYRLQALIPVTLTRARRVFVLSEAMREELLECYGHPADRISLVPPAVHPRFAAGIDRAAVERVRAKHHLPADYVLYVGALQPRKNLGRLFEAFARVRGEGFPHRLAIAGQEVWMTRPMRETVHQLGLEDALVFTGYLDDADLPALFHGAAAFVYVSIYEGFGIPVAEAMACGAPVLTSNTGALAEVAGDAALTCDPYDVEAIAEGLRVILTDTATRARLCEAGPRRASCYSFENMAAALEQGYRRTFDDTL